MFVPTCVFWDKPGQVLGIDIIDSKQGSVYSMASHNNTIRTNTPAYYGIYTLRLLDQSNLYLMFEGSNPTTGLTKKNLSKATFKL